MFSISTVGCINCARQKIYDILISNLRMQASEMNPELSTLDKSKIAPLQQKRTLAFVNHFLVTNVQFLNNFMSVCEQKLMQFEHKLEKVNAAMVLLESKLSSIPELDIPKAPDSTENKTQLSEVQENTQDKEAEVMEPTEEKNDSLTETRPEYDRFVKMVHVGVPLQAVKLKVSLEGLDPNVFESIMNK